MYVYAHMYRYVCMFENVCMYIALCCQSVKSVATLPIVFFQSSEMNGMRLASVRWAQGFQDLKILGWAQGFEDLKILGWAKRILFSCFIQGVYRLFGFILTTRHC